MGHMFHGLFDFDRENNTSLEAVLMGAQYLKMLIAHWLVQIKGRMSSIEAT